DATGEGRIVRLGVHLLTLVSSPCSIAGPLGGGSASLRSSFHFPRVGQAFGTYQFLINERGRMMKKLLLGSTALVAGGLMAAPAMAADPIKIGVGGYYQFFALAGNIEGVYAPDGTSLQYKGLQFIQEGEIHFIGQT